MQTWRKNKKKYRIKSMKKVLYLIIASQDFESANHQNLWLEMAEQSGEDVMVANIHADYIVSRLTRKSYRIQEAKAAPVRISEHLSVMRPLLWIRQELLPESLYWVARKGFWDSVKKAVPDVMERKVKLLVYNACWVKVLAQSHPDMSIGYYLFDEVRSEGRDGNINKKRYLQDEFACKNSNVIYTMTKMLEKSRREYNDNIITIGNGAVYPINREKPVITFDKSVAFVGVFRDWIDRILLKELIKKRQDILFAFVGPVTPEMDHFFHELLNNCENTIYYGIVKKVQMPELYRRFNGIIIPYLNNPFVKATRPIKIVESILSGTPVVTIPMDGYEENEFIRFATTPDEFSEQIDYILANPINEGSESYRSFVNANTWQKKAEIILKTI